MRQAPFDSLNSLLDGTSHQAKLIAERENPLGNKAHPATEMWTW